MWIQNDFDSIVSKYETIERHSSICKYVLQIPSQVATLIIAFHAGFFSINNLPFLSSQYRERFF